VAWPDPRYYSMAAKHTLTLLDALHQQIAADPGVALVTTVAELRAARAAGKLAIFLCIEGGEALEGELALLRMYHRLGVRVLGLTWNHRNALADGAMEWETGGGLSTFGKAVVKEMNRLGMVVDMSHLAPRPFFDVLEVSADPVLFTHGNVRAIFDHPRNLTDEQIKALAAHGGVFGISFVGIFMAQPGSPLTIDDVVRQIDHVVQLVGPDHVAIGSDFDGTNWTPTGLESVLGLPKLVAALMNRGYDEPALLKILGENYLRVMERVLDRK
jgi:membrane dipeptidase